MDIRFDGQIVVVTGAAHGMGRAICQAFAERGAHVWGCDVLPDELAETRRLCADRGGGSCEVRVVDITHHEEVSAFIAEVTHSGQPVSVLVNNAGGVLGQVGKPIEQVSPQDWNALLAVNVSAAFYMSQAVVPGMKAASSGRIVNISSGAGLGVSLTGIQAYASAKAALVNLTRQLAHELGEWNITVNSIAPGFVRSNPNTEKQWQSYGEQGQRDLVNRIALKRLGTPEDIAYGVLFFASPYAAWITGQILSIDGGK